MAPPALGPATAPPGAPSWAQVLRATEASGSARVTLQSSHNGRVQVNSGTVDFATGRARMVRKTTGSGGIELGGTEIAAGGNLYLLLRSGVGGPTRWIEVLDEPARDAFPLLFPTSALYRGLDGASGLTAEGPAVVDGVPTTGYRVRSSCVTSPGSITRLAIWVDGEHRMVEVQAVLGSGRRRATVVTVDLGDFGRASSVVAPGGPATTDPSISLGRGAITATFTIGRPKACTGGLWASAAG